MDTIFALIIVFYILTIIGLLTILGFQIYLKRLINNQSSKCPRAANINIHIEKLCKILVETYESVTKENITPAIQETLHQRLIMLFDKNGHIDQKSIDLIPSAEPKEANDEEDVEYAEFVNVEPKSGKNEESLRTSNHLEHLNQVLETKQAMEYCYYEEPKEIQLNSCCPIELNAIYENLDEVENEIKPPLPPRFLPKNN